MPNHDSNISGRYTLIAAIIAGVFGLSGILLKHYLDQKEPKYQSEIVSEIPINIDSVNNESSVLEKRDKERIYKFSEVKAQFKTIEFDDLIESDLQKDFYNIQEIPGFNLIDEIESNGFPNKKLRKVYHVVNVINPLTEVDFGNFYMFEYGGLWSCFSDKFDFFEKVGGFFNTKNNASRQ